MTCTSCVYEFARFTDSTRLLHCIGELLSMKVNGEGLVVVTCIGGVETWSASGERSCAVLVGHVGTLLALAHVWRFALTATHPQLILLDTALPPVLLPLLAAATMLME